MEIFWIEDSLKVTSGGDLPTLILTRPGYEADLRAEFDAKSPPGAGLKAGMENVQQGKGWVLLPQRCVNPVPYIFERQRLPGARLLTGDTRRERVRQAAAWIAPNLRDKRSWHLQAYAAAVREKSLAYLGRVTSADLDKDVQVPGQDPRTAGDYLAILMSDYLHHCGQISYLRGYLKGWGWFPM